MYKDKPITELEEDKLNRARFIRATVVQLQTITDKSNFIVGLYARWGSGKSSILNLLKKELQSKSYYTAYFNPWFFQNENDLLVELFKTILKGARSDEKLKPTINVIGAALKKYAEFIRLPKVSFLGVEVDCSDIAQASTKALGTYLDEEPTLEEQKEKVNQQLRTLDKPLIIFLDDIDRLDKEEIRLLFKTVRLTADFDNIIYVLAFDEDIVSKSLNSYYGSGQEEEGRKFIEKIIQLPIRVPELSVEDKFRYTNSLLEKWENTSGVILPLRYREGFYEQLRTVHRLFLETPRDSKRLVNSFAFVEVSLRGEVNAADLVLIECLRLFTPKLFQYLLSHKELLFGNPAAKKGQNITAAIDPREIPLHKREGTMALLNWLFPENDIAFGEGAVFIHDLPLHHFDHHESIMERKSSLSKNQCIGSRPYFLKYIEFNIGPDQIPDETFKAVLQAFNTKDFKELTKSIDQLEEFSSPIIYTKFEIFEEELNEKGKSNLLCMLFLKAKFAPSFAFTSTLTGTLQNLNNIIKKTVCFLDGFSEQADVESTLRFITMRSPHLQAVSFLLHHLEHSYSQLQNQGALEHNFLHKLDLTTLKKDFAARALALDTDDLFQDPAHNKNWDLFAILSDLDHAIPLKDKISAWTSLCPDNALSLIQSFTSMGQSAGALHYSTSNFRYTFEQVEKYAGRETLVEAARILCSEPKEVDPIIEHLSEMELIDLNDSGNALSYEYLKYVLLDEQQAERQRILRNVFDEPGTGEAH